MRLFLPLPAGVWQSIAALCLLLFSGSRNACGQALATADGAGSNLTVGGGLSWFQQSYGSRHIGGTVLYADLHPHWRYGIEGEARMLRLNTSEQVNESSYLAGPRIVLSRRPSLIQPYGKFLAGAGRITLPFGYAHGTFFSYAAGAGVDISWTDYCKIRVFDLEWQRWTNFPYGQLQPYGISTGISVRLNRLRRFPDAKRP